MHLHASQAFFSVYIATYRHPDLLEKPLVSLERQELNDAVVIMSVTTYEETSESGAGLRVTGATVLSEAQRRREKDWRGWLSHRSDKSTISSEKLQQFKAVFGLLVEG